jgi:hypothetical protein
MRLRDVLGCEPEPLHEHLRPGERILYVGRLAPVPRPGAAVVGDLAAALRELPSRPSKTNAHLRKPSGG